MRAYTIPLFLALTGILFTIMYVYIKARKTKVSSSFILFLLDAFLWMGVTFILHNSYVSPFTFFMLKLSAVFTYFLGFFVLNFVYAFLNRRPDFVYKSSLFLSFFFSFLYCFTGIIAHFPPPDKIASSTRFFNAFYYIAEPYGGLILKVSFFISVVLPVFYSLYLVNKERLREINQDRKRQLDIFFIGGTVTFVIGTLLTILIGKYFASVLLILLQVLAALSIIAFSVMGMRRFGFLIPSVEAFSEELFNNAQDGIIILDPDGRIVNMNKVAISWFSLEDVHVEGMPITSVIKEYSYDSDSFEFKREGKFFNVKKIPISEGKTLIGIIVIIIDITEQRRLEEELITLNAELQQRVTERTTMLQETVEELETEMETRLEREEELRETMNLYKTLFESGSDAIFLTDKNGYIIDVNGRACEMVGKREEEILGLNIFGLLEFERKDIETIKRSLDPDENILIEGILGRNRQKSIEIEANIRQVVIAGEMDYLIFVRDITQRKEIERQAINMSKLESISIFAGGIAHDFNNMLTAIFGNLSLIKLKVEKESEIYRGIERIEAALNEAESLTSQLLSLSKGGEPIREATTIEELLKDTITFVLRGSSVKPIFEIPENLPSVSIDKGQISRVLQNIVVNSMEAMSSGGIIRVVVKEIEVTFPQREFIQGDRALEIIIEDNGPGIPKDVLPHIFDPFFTTKKKGSGLGLAAAYSIVKRHGGYIEAHSEEGKGATFCIYLPITDDESSSSLDTTFREKEKVKHGEGIRVLVMDDEEMIRDFLYEALAIQKYEVELAKDGEEAISKYRNALSANKPFDIVIIDLTIPGGMGGKETIKKLKEIDPSVVAIVSSGYSDTDVMARYREYGFSGYLHKPYTISELFSIINNVISEKEEKNE